MLDLSKFGNIVAQPARSMKMKPMPLLSWDFYGEYFDTLKTAVADASCLTGISRANRWKSHWNYLEELKQDKTILVTDAKLNIIFASQNIIMMTGYSNDEVVGKNPKMFQGAGTSRQDLLDMRDAIHSRKPFEKVVVNYKKNGEAYDCHIKAFPIFNSKNELVNFVAFETAA
ncbi:MAG TPA: PAS domain-containing protein [Flavobacterium sp.]|nr:PAS domain-containing protein [Flavobacterium sp.]